MEAEQTPPENSQPAVAGISKWKIYLIQVLIFLIVVVGIRYWQQRDIVLGPAPELYGITIDGSPYILPRHPAKPVLVYFWATWCPICRVEQGTIASLAKDKGNVVGVAMQSGSKSEVLKYMKEQGIAFPVVNDEYGMFAQAWGVQGVPTSFIIAPDGKIRNVEVGYTTGIGLRLRLWLAED
jgi:thiol-disulfide isomerase/thioredoxin